MWQFSFETCQINKAEFSASRFLGSLVDDILGLSAPILPCFIRPSSLHSTLAQRQAKLTPAWAEPRGLWAMWGRNWHSSQESIDMYPPPYWLARLMKFQLHFHVNIEIFSVTECNHSPIRHLSEHRLPLHLHLLWLFDSGPTVRLMSHKPLFTCRKQAVFVFLISWSYSDDWKGRTI